jgi:hypothetical protein
MYLIEMAASKHQVVDSFWSREIWSRSMSDKPAESIPLNVVLPITKVAKGFGR